MADKAADKAAEDQADQASSGTDNFPTFQDDDGKNATGKDDADEVELDHGQESSEGKAAREAMEKNPPSPTPAQWGSPKE